ncbi:ComF family protein [Sphingobium phenoxybenzoativorans]|uniref:ComF family protein n=1 Tax=Sphingobium phenoxybenzoativorans TaxID=1592790 RepID=A0A975K4A4_9SPHN|nr:ComF family protein [Sphingobium phenoxybenzoativorans]QUT04575.1 ComF family protein [Sphingobium phenoxybenzoativorans]
MSMASVSRTIWWKIIGYALPPRCPGCGVIVEDDHRFCLTCWSSMRFLSEPCCDRCGAPFDHDRGEGALCGACLSDPPVVGRARAVLAYGDIARTVALRLKYGRRIGLARLIAGQMGRFVPVEGRAEMLLVPVPLHRWRLWWRGFNQSALIADHLGRLSGIAVEKEALLRTRRTPPLRGLDPGRRKKTVRGAFSVSLSRKHRLMGKTIILIDDVHTSGATADACARILLRNGAAAVHLICWARVLPETAVKAD